jgi:hypothetical protein
MAIPAQGCVITWQDFVGGGSAQTVQEVATIDIRPSVERIDFAGQTYFWRGGEISLTGFSNAVLGTSRLLTWGTLKITVRSGAQNLVLHEGYAQLLSTTAQATVNEAILFAFQIRLWGVFNSTGTLQ